MFGSKTNRGLTALVLSLALGFLNGCGGGGGDVANASTGSPSPTPSPTPVQGVYSASVEWDRVSSDVFGNPVSLSGYNVYLAEDEPSFTTPLSTVNTTSVEVENLSPGVTYYLSVSAYDTTGNESALSAPAMIRQ